MSRGEEGRGETVRERVGVGGPGLLRPQRNAAVAVGLRGRLRGGTGPRGLC